MFLIDSNKTFFQSFFPEGVFVIPEKPKEVVENVEVEKIYSRVSLIGENRKKILILLNEPGSTIINEQDKEFLSKILGAVKLNFTDVAVVNLSHNPGTTYQELEGQIDFKRLILLGTDLIRLFENKKLFKYNLNEVELIPVLYADSLGEIQEDKTKKVKLWEALKQMFP